MPAGNPPRTSGVLRPSRTLPLRTSLAARLGLILGVTVALSVAALFVLLRFQRQAVAALLASEVHERSEMLEQTIALASRPLVDFVEDYANWDDMVRFVATPKRNWAAINLDVSLENFGLSGIWVLRPDASVVYATRGKNKGTPPPPLPLSAAALATVLAEPPEESFFVQLPDRVVELYLTPVRPSDDLARTTPPRGWVIAEKTWNRKQLQLLSRSTLSRGYLAAPSLPLPAVQPHEIAQRHPLPGVDGKPVADFVYVITSAESKIAADHGQTVLLVFGICALASGLVIVSSVYWWVLRPLAAVVDSVAHDTLAPIAPLVVRSDEIGQLARVVETSFAQRAELQRNLADRNRLGRELHDGAIQTVYAAGMSLGGARALLRQDPAAAEQAIDAIRAALNTTIRDLRTFLEGIEPEPPPHSAFSAGVRSILALLQGVRPIDTTLKIDDTLAEQLPARVRLHLLQIIRETASNCARHSQARSLQIVLQREHEFAKLEISDDGVGLTPSAEPGPGRGLANLADRSKELGGTLQIDSAPGQGLRVQLTFACPGSRPPHPQASATARATT